MGAIYGVVAGHYGGHPRLLDSLAETWEINLVDRTLVGIGTRAVAVVFLLVQGKMLDGRHHSLFLHAADIGRSCLAGQIGVFAVVFEVASAKGAAIDVHARAQHDLHAVGLGSATDASTHLPHRIAVPAGRSGYSAGIEGALDILTVYISHSLRAVGHAEGRDSKPGDGIRAKTVDFPGNKFNLFFDRHFGHQCGGAVFMFLGNFRGRHKRSRCSHKQDCCQKGEMFVVHIAEVFSQI